MMMIKKLYKQCEASVTQFSDRLRSDPFYAARLKLTALIFVAGVIVSIVISDLADHFLREDLYRISLLETGPAVDAAFQQAQQKLWVWRIVKLLLIVLAAYYLAAYSFRSIRRSAQFQRHFVANVSHELRTPLATMKASLEVALRKKERLTMAEAVSALEKTSHEVDTLSGIVQLMLTFADVENRSKPLAMERIDISALAHSTVGRKLERRKDIGEGRIIVEVEPGVIVHGNYVALESLLTNLLRNALSHTPAPGTITVRVQTDIQGRPELSVADTGSGIAKDELRHVFEPFYRAAGEEARGGLGLGLSIVREIAYVHNARLIISSEENKGTTVTLVFL